MIRLVDAGRKVYRVSFTQRDYDFCQGPLRQEFLLRRIEASSATTDFFSVEVWTAGGLTRFAVLFVMDLATRRVEIAGIVREPDSAWVSSALAS